MSSNYTFWDLLKEVPKRFFLLLLCVATVAGCTQDARNGGKNEQRQDRAAVIRSSDPVDQAITQRLRQRLVTDSSMSVNAQNLGITTVNRHVTVHGAVDNAAELNKVIAIIRSTGGIKQITSAMEVLDTDALEDSRSGAARSRHD